jgi:uncharacterized integral membrane protein (TIGR00697 family)
MSTAAASGPRGERLAQDVYLACAGLSVTALLVADFLGPKFFDYGDVLGWQLRHSAGMLAFPLTFLVTDVVNEYYGAAGARRIALLSFAMGAASWLAIVAAQAMPVAADSPVSQADFERVFGAARSVYVASLIAYLAGQLCDIAVFRAVKRLTGQRLLWLRATGSTVVSQLVDSFVITSLFLWGQGVMSDGTVVTWDMVWRTALTGYGLKFALALATTPLIYLAHALLRPRLRPV